ncbi:CDP-diacylglycerol--serine O-phosphatidyltransferase [Lentzea sp. NPDC051208]|uniref:CDP-diacylglycerol--serine O-phosphatidyltransferase n=1 Tax=Lentzea sp. NPDC051208 TaxID=3154642 RepID=UPI00342183FF
MCSGLSAVHFANVGMWGAAIAAIAAAAVFDGLDGRIARMLDATSKMGAELDSLADAISFGVAPALAVYLWKFEGSRAGWVIALIFAVCMVVRLARFNTLLEKEQPPFAKEFFVGVPAPAGGLLLLLPLIIEEQVKVPPRAVASLLLAVGLLAAAIVTYPLVALIIAMVVYLAHLPYSVRWYLRLSKHPEAWTVTGADHAHTASPPTAADGAGPSANRRRRSWLQLGLRRQPKR